MTLEALAAPARAWRAPCLLLLVLMTFCLSCSEAQAQQFTFRKYGQTEGLANLATSCLIQDHAGYIWTCTENGLFRYDGGEFTNYGAEAGLDQASILTLVEDASNRLWVGTATDLYLGEGGKFSPVRPEGRSLSIAAGARVASLDVDHALVIEKGTLLNLHRSGASMPWRAEPYFTDQQVVKYPELGKLSALLVDPSGRLWLGCDTYLCEVRSNHVQVWDEAVGVPSEAWKSLLLDHRGQIWARGSRHAVMLPRGAARFETHDPPGGAITALLAYVPLTEDSDGRILTRSANGLARWSEQGWQSFGAANGLPPYEAFDLLVDREGALWIAVSGHGLSRWLGYGNWEAWTANQGIDPDIVWSAQRDSAHRLVVGARPGCRVLTPGASAFVPCQAEGLPPGEITTAIQDVDGSLVLAQPGGKIFRVDLDRKKARLVASLSSVLHLILDRRKRLWALTNEGPFLLEGRGGDTPWHAVNSSGVDSRIAGAAEDAGNGKLWFASLSGLLRLTDDQWRVLKIDDDRTRDGFAQVMPAGNGWLWLASSSRGLLRAHVEGDVVDQWQWVDDPLVADASLLFLRTDRRGWLWVGTDAGIVIFDGQKWQRFSQSDGLIWNDIDQNAFLVDTDDSVWIGTSGGLSHILHPEKLFTVSPLSAMISRAAFGSLKLSDDERKVLPWRSDSALHLRLSSMSPSQSEGAVFRHRLVGLSKEWFETRNPDVNYPGLGPGRYRFEVVALNGDHGLESPPATLEFIIAPPWWRTPSSYLLLAVFVVTATTLIWRWRVRQIVAGQQLRERQLREREALLERATRDALTGLWNRAVILDHLAQEITLAVNYRSALALVIIDIDHFKQINDNHGHLVGDQVLRRLGEHLSRAVRTSDRVGRYGGEEFLLVMPGMSEAHPSEVIERLRQSIAEVEIVDQATHIRVTASFGVAWLMPERDTPDLLIGRADRSLYAAKRGGRNRVEYARASEFGVPTERRSNGELAGLA